MAYQLISSIFVLTVVVLQIRDIRSMNRRIEHLKASLKTTQTLTHKENPS